MTLTTRSRQHDLRPPSPWGPTWSRPIGHCAAKVLWSTRIVGAHHVPTTGPVILAANHVGLIDGPLVLGTAPRKLHILVKEEMFSGPVGLILRAAGQIPVDRTGGRAALTVAREVLNRGDAVGVFPEGNRGRGDVSDARGGVAWLALRTGAPVIPMAVLGTRRTGEPLGRIPGLRRPLHISFGAPMVIERLPGVAGRTAQADACERIRVALADVVREAVAFSGIELPVDDPNDV